MYHGFQTFSYGCKERLLNGRIEEEVYVDQPPGFVDYENPNHVYKLIKKFGMEKSKEVSTSMATSTYLDLDEKGKSVEES